MTEEYALSLELFCHALAIAKPQIIESKNVGKNRLGEVSVSAELKAKIKQLNAADCELYELGKQLFEKQIQDYKINPPPTRDHFNVDFSTIPNGYGWYQQEKSRFGKYFCWSGPETCSNLFIPTLKPGQYQITFRASNSFKPELVKQITATWNDQPLELTMQKSTKTKSTFTSQVLIEDSPKSAFLRFFVPSTHKPSDFLSKSEDQRLLGCCFKDITITPL